MLTFDGSKSVAIVVAARFRKSIQDAKGNRLGPFMYVLSRFSESATDYPELELVCSAAVSHTQRVLFNPMRLIPTV